jgi:hypothetical protein
VRNSRSGEGDGERHGDTGVGGECTYAYYYELCDMRADLVTIREGLPSPVAQRDERPSLSGLSEDITAAIVLLECAEDKMFNLLPREEFASPT